MAAVTKNRNFFNCPFLLIQITTYIMMRTLNIPAVVRRSEMDKLTYLMDQYSKLQSGEKDHYHFIKAIGYKYSAVTNP